MSPARRHLWSSRSRSAGITDALRRTQRLRRLRKRITAANGSCSKASSAQTNDHEGGITQDADNMTQLPLFEKLPKDILNHIHSLLPVPDAACAACVSHAFLSSWRCYSKLILNDDVLRLTHMESDESKNHLIYKVDKILKNHHNNGVEVESLDLILSPCGNIKASYLDRWLKRTVKSGFKKLHLELPLAMQKSYNFPCSVLSNTRAANSIQFLHLASCVFQPTSTLGCLTKLKILILSYLHITEKELEQLFSKSSTLEELTIYACTDIVCLKIPYSMQHLKILHLKRCKMLQMVEIDAPHLCYFHYDSASFEIYVRNSLQLKHVELSSYRPSGVLFYARVSIPSIAQNVESLILVGCSENASTPMLQSKLPHLKKLEIELGSGTCFPLSYDIVSLVSFLDASPALESFILRVSERAMEHYTVVGDDDEWPVRNVGFWHDHLRQVTITGFCSAKSLVELTVHILESTHSLERLTLDTTCGYDRRMYGPGTIGKCPNSIKIGRCWPMSKRDVEEANRAVETAGRCITGRVPLAVQYEVLEPCSRCHTSNQ